MKGLAYCGMAFQLVFILCCKPALAHVRPVNLECVAGTAQLILPMQQFFQHISIEPERDPTRLSVLISAALNQRYGRNIQAGDIAGLMNAPFKGKMHSFLDIKTVIKKTGYHVSAYRINVQAGHSVYAHDVGFLIDNTILPNSRVIALLFASGSGSKYLLYANGILCPMSDQQFEKRFNNSVFLRLD